MNNYKMDIQYDGTRYNGWQKQGNTENTIQAKLEEVIFNLIGIKTEVIGSGRTDAGVHAKHQVCNFKVEEELDIKEFKNDLNKYLPKDIRINFVEKVDERFHSRLNAKEKVYAYYIDNSKVNNVFTRKYNMLFADRLDINKMKRAAEYLIGEHDFKSFCTKSGSKKPTIRTIKSIEITEMNGNICIKYQGNGFLYNMVRILTGTLMEVGRGDKTPESMKNIIEAKDRKEAGFTAAAQGLFLENVIY
jgi:tRNA pseudouridine38-40 synthase